MGRLTTWAWPVDKKSARALNVNRLVHCHTHLLHFIPLCNYFPLHLPPYKRDPTIPANTVPDTSRHTQYHVPVESNWTCQPRTASRVSGGWLYSYRSPLPFMGLARAHSWYVRYMFDVCTVLKLARYSITECDSQPACLPVCLSR